MVLIDRDKTGIRLCPANICVDDLNDRDTLFAGQCFRHCALSHCFGAHLAGPSLKIDAMADVDLGALC